MTHWKQRFIEISGYAADIHEENTQLKAENDRLLNEGRKQYDIATERAKTIDQLRKAIEELLKADDEVCRDFHGKAHLITKDSKMRLKEVLEGKDDSK
jgi:regulator of replication initiation timing